MPIGGGGNTTLSKRVDGLKISTFGLALEQTKRNTDFAMNYALRSDNSFFTAQGIATSD